MVADGGSMMWLDYAGIAVFAATGALAAAQRGQAIVTFADRKSTRLNSSH